MSEQCDFKIGDLVRITGLSVSGEGEDDVGRVLKVVSVLSSRQEESRTYRLEGMRTRYVSSSLKRVENPLPVGMEHCTILSKKCKKGHGWLTAKNWEPFDCPWCSIDALKQQLKYTAEASALFEQNSAACSEEFEKRLKVEKQLDWAVAVLKTTNEAFGSHPADAWYQKYYFTVVEEIEFFLSKYGNKQQTTTQGGE